MQFIIPFLILLLVFSPAQAFQITATVNVHVDKLPLDERDYVTGLGDLLKRKVEEFRWVDGVNKVTLPLQIEIFFDTYSRAGLAHRYTCGILVGGKNGIQLRDRRWDFKYTKDEGFNIGEPFNTFGGLVEFYTWICIGFEMDRFKSLGGTTFYEQARLVGERARGEGQYSLGWDDRRSLALSLCDTTYKAIRQARATVEYGLYLAGAEKWDDARSVLDRAVSGLLTCSPKDAELHRSDHILRFVDLDKLAQTLKSAGMSDDLDRLSKWDKEGADRYH